MTTLFMLLLAAMTATPPIPSEPPTQMGADALPDYGDVHSVQDVKIGNHTYRFPVVEHLVTYFGNGAVEVVVSDEFWCSIKSAIDPKNWPTGICGLGSGTQTIYFSMPNQLYQWRTDRRPGLPPVRGPVEIWREVGTVKLWRSLDPEIHDDGLLYATFSGRADIYGECNEGHLDWSHSCWINWFDGTMIHRLSVPAPWIENAPAAVDEYRRRIRPTLPPA